MDCRADSGIGKSVFSNRLTLLTALAFRNKNIVKIQGQREVFMTRGSTMNHQDFRRIDLILVSDHVCSTLCETSLEGKGI